jgi:hypothetical protein
VPEAPEDAAPTADPAPAGPPTPDEVREQIDRLFRSALFERSARLQQFLKYIADRTLRGEGEQINEYLIGTEVFGRGGDYSPGDDAVVRRQAHALRAKLQAYYNDEGRHDAVRIDLPVGHYVPVFRRQERAEAPPKTEGPGPSPRLPQLSRRRWGAAGALIAAAVAGGLGGFLAGRGGRGAGPALLADPSIEAVWGRWLADGKGATICLTSSTTATVVHAPDEETAAARTNEAGGRVALAAGSAADEHLRKSFKLPAGGTVLLSAERDEGKLGDAQAAVRLGAFFGRLGVPIRSTQAMHLSWDVLRHENVVLVGMDSGTWVSALLAKAPLRIFPAERDQPRRIVDTTAARGPAASYANRRPDAPGGPFEQVALVSMLPGLDGRRQLLLVTGLNHAATDAAVEWMSDPASLAELAARLRTAAPGTSGPWHFQAVLRAEVRKGVGMRATIAALKVL